jgi:hypothetical protein
MFGLGEQRNLCHKLWNIPGARFMAKSNPFRTVEVTLSLNTQTAWYLDQLVQRGLHGNNRAEAAKKLVADQCEALIEAGSLIDAGRSGEAIAVPKAASEETR